MVDRNEWRTSATMLWIYNRLLPIPNWSLGGKQRVDPAHEIEIST